MQILRFILLIGLITVFSVTLATAINGSRPARVLLLFLCLALIVLFYLGVNNV